MKHAILLSLALVVTPAIAAAQDGPPPGPPPEAGAWTPPTAAQRAQMEQFRTAARQYRMQSRASMLAALTPAHRAAIGSIVGQLVLSPNPNFAAAVAQVDAILSVGEKQSIVNIATTERTYMRTLMQQQRTAMEATLSSDQRAAIEARHAKIQASIANHPHPAHAADPAAIVLHTLADVGAPMHDHGMEPR